MWLVVRHGAHQHVLAEIVHMRRDAHHAPGGGKTAVGRHDQPGAQHLAVFQRHRATVGIAAHIGHLDPCQQRDVAVVFLGLLHGIDCSLADQVVGHQPAQLSALAQFMANHHRIGGGSVHHLGVAQGGNGRGVDALPQAQRLHQLGRLLGERDLAAVKGGLLDARLGLLLDHEDFELASAQGPRHAQPGRAGSHNHDIRIHTVPSRNGTARIPAPVNGRLVFRQATVK